MTDFGAENALGLPEGEDAQTLRDRLALATRYLANWYKATADSTDKAIWWQRIDTLRSKVERVYSMLTTKENTFFAGNAEVAAYLDASQEWAALWRDISLSPDVNVHIEFLNALADLPTQILHAPSAILSDIGNEVGKAIDGTLGNLFRRAWPWLLGAAAVGGVYAFRGPIGRLIK